MPKIRKFRVTAIRQADCSGVGIEEYTGKGDDVEIIAIHSVFYPQRFSNRDLCIAVIQYVKSLLEPDEQAVIRCANMVAKRSWTLHYNPRITMRRESYRAGFNDVYKLANDAIKRRGTITERLSET